MRSLTKATLFLLWISLCGGVIAVFLLMLLAGMIRQYGLTGMGASCWDEAAGALSLCLCVGASVLTLLRLRGLRGLPWLPRLYVGMTVLAVAVLLPFLPSRDAAVQNLLLVMTTPVGVLILQWLLHVLLNRLTRPAPAAPAPESVQVPFAQIVAITREALTWRDDAGEHRVDLARCARNWRAAHPGASGKCVGDRHAPGHILLYADEPILLVNDVPGDSLRSLAYEAFCCVTLQLTDAGWTTCDMT